MRAATSCSSGASAAAHCLPSGSSQVRNSATSCSSHARPYGRSNVIRPSAFRYATSAAMFCWRQAARQRGARRPWQRADPDTGARRAPAASVHAPRNASRNSRRTRASVAAEAWRRRHCPSRAQSCWDTRDARIRVRASPKPSTILSGRDLRLRGNAAQRGHCQKHCLSHGIASAKNSAERQLREARRCQRTSRETWIRKEISSRPTESPSREPNVVHAIVRPLALAALLSFTAAQAADITASRHERCLEGGACR